MGSFKDENTIEVVSSSAETKVITADNIVLAVGLRPNYPQIPGAVEFGITSDDLFSLGKSPGRTLVVGGSYVALECAGFLNGLNLDVTLMVRSIPLRGFDQQMANLVLENLIECGVSVRMRSVPVKVEKVGEGLKVTWTSRDSDQMCTDIFDTVMFATGREAKLDALKLERAGVCVNEEHRRVMVSHDDKTSVDNIYAIGDIAMNRPELTPTAIQAGKLLARRLYGNSTATVDYTKVPTTVFTPLEYGCVGLSEEQALERYGEDSIEVYHAHYTPLEYTLPQKNAKQCYIKVVCSLPHEEVVGLHFTGPNAGEVLQGFAVAMRSGLQWSDLQQTIGIHPTCAEEVVKLHITKRSGENPVVTGC
jgi:thioredoxin reductase (NADPH)